MKAIKDTFSIIGRILLEWVATLLAFVVYPIFLVSQLISVINKRAVLKQLAKRSLENAVQIDIFYNMHYANLWNMIFRKKIGYDFGQQETLSEAMAKNMRLRTLTLFGWLVAFFINVADVTAWGKGGHFKGLADNEL